MKRNMPSSLRLAIVDCDWCDESIYEEHDICTSLDGESVICPKCKGREILAKKAQP